MKVIKAGYEIVRPNFNNPGWKEAIYGTIERAGRICYQSEMPTEGGSGDFIRRLVSRGHESVLEHAVMSVIFTVDRGVSHELVRHRIASYSQESTRYCNYSKDKFGNEITVIVPCFFQDISENDKKTIQKWVRYEQYEDMNEAGLTEHQLAYAAWYDGCLKAESEYFEMLDSGAKPEEARDVLPTSVKTTVFMTANMREWRQIFRLRAAGEHGMPHPQMREVMVPLFKEVRSYMPELFDDILLPEEQDQVLKG